MNHEKIDSLLNDFIEKMKQELVEPTITLCAPIGWTDEQSQQIEDFLNDTDLLGYPLWQALLADALDIFLAVASEESALVHHNLKNSISRQLIYVWLSSIERQKSTHPIYHLHSIAEHGLSAIQAIQQEREDSKYLLPP